MNDELKDFFIRRVYELSESDKGYSNCVSFLKVFLSENEILLSSTERLEMEKCIPYVWKDDIFLSLVKLLIRHNMVSIDSIIRYIEKFLIDTDRTTSYGENRYQSLLYCSRNYILGINYQNRIAGLKKLRKLSVGYNLGQLFQQKRCGIIPMARIMMYM